MFVPSPVNPISSWRMTTLLSVMWSAALYRRPAEFWLAVVQFWKTIESIS